MTEVRKINHTKLKYVVVHKDGMLRLTLSDAQLLYEQLGVMLQERKLQPTKSMESARG